MAILNAIIENNGNTLIIDFPHSIYDVYEKLLSIGIRKSPNDIMLTDNEDDDIQVKLYSDSDFHIGRMFFPQWVGTDTLHLLSVIQKFFYFFKSLCNSTSGTMPKTCYINLTITIHKK